MNYGTMMLQTENHPFCLLCLGKKHEVTNYEIFHQCMQKTGHVSCVLGIGHVCSYPEGGPFACSAEVF